MSTETLPGAEPNATPAATQAAQPGPLEQKALALGWNPDYEGENALDAQSYVLMHLDRALETSEKRKEANAKLRQNLGKMAQENAKISGESYARAIKDLKAQRDAAIEDGDKTAVERLDEQIDHAKQAQAKAKQADIPGHEEIAEWESKNPWIVQGSAQYDAEATEDAKAFFVAHLNRHPGDTTGALEAVEKKMRKTYPEKFGAPKPQQREQPRAPAVEGGRSPAGGKPAARGYADLPPEAKRACDAMVRVSGISKEGYAKNFWESMK